MKKLSEAKNGETGVISAICGDTRFLSRVTSIGLTIGCPVTVLQNERKRPILIFSRDSMIALDRGECDNIQMGGDTSRWEGIKHEYGTDQRDGHCPAGAA